MQISETLDASQTHTDTDVKGVEKANSQYKVNDFHSATVDRFFYFSDMHLTTRHGRYPCWDTFLKSISPQLMALPAGRHGNGRLSCLGLVSRAGRPGTGCFLEQQRQTTLNTEPSITHTLCRVLLQKSIPKAIPLSVIMMLVILPVKHPL